MFVGKPFNGNAIQILGLVVRACSTMPVTEVGHPPDHYHASTPQQFSVFCIVVSRSQRKKAGKKGRKLLYRHKIKFV